MPQGNSDPPLFLHPLPSQILPFRTWGRSRKLNEAFSLWCSRLRIWCCHCCGSGYCCGTSLIPGLGTSTGLGLGQKNHNEMKQSFLKNLIQEQWGGKQWGWEGRFLFPRPVPCLSKGTRHTSLSPRFQPPTQKFRDAFGVAKNLAVFFLSLSLFGHSQYMEVSGQGSEPSCSCDLSGS